MVLSQQAKLLKAYNEAERTAIELSKVRMIDGVNEKILAKYKQYSTNLKIIWIQAVVRGWMARRRFKIMKNKYLSQQTTFKLIEIEQSNMKQVEIDGQDPQSAPLGSVIQKNYE